MSDWSSDVCSSDLLTEIEHRVAMTEVARFRDSVEVEGVRTVRGTEAVTRIGVSFPCRQHRGMDEQRMISIHPDLLPISFIDRPVGSGSHAQLSARCRVDQDVDHLGCVAEIVLERKDLFAPSREYEAAIDRKSVGSGKRV